MANGPHMPISRRQLLGALAAGIVLPSSSGTIEGAVADDSTRLLSGIDDAADLELLRKMIQIRSYTHEEAPLAKFLVDDMKRLGLETQLQEVQPGRYNAIGVLRGSGGGKSIILNGHIDTNPVGEGWTVDPVGGVVKDECVYGIGVSNMKASCAAFVGAARAFIQSKTKPRGDIIITHVVGELSGGDGTRKVVQSGIKADYFIVGEPTDLALLTVHASGTEVTINTIGDTRHMSKLEESVSAIDTMYKVIERLKVMKFTDSPRSNPEYASIRRVNVGTMRAALGREFQEWRTPQVPDFAQIKVAIRFGPDLTSESVLADVKREMEALHKADPKVVVEVVAPERNPNQPRLTYEIPKDHVVVRVLAENYCKIVGQAPPIGAIAPYRYYGTDAPQLQHAGMVGIVCGVGGKYNTMPDERVELKDYRAATRMFALAASQLCG
jgi:acetylornithine deacetylase